MDFLPAEADWVRAAQFLSMQEPLLSRTSFSVATLPSAAQVVTECRIKVPAAAAVLGAAAEPAISLLVAEGEDSPGTAARSSAMAAAVVAD